MGREQAGHSLRPTALIHEAYLRFLGSKTVDLRDRSHFYALASRLMRRILVDHARSRGRRKRAAPLRRSSSTRQRWVSRNGRISCDLTTR